MSISRQPRARRAPPGGLPTIRLLVAADRYDWTEKVQIAIEEGWFQPEDLECCIAAGVVTKTKRDKAGISVGQKIYTILGPDCSGCMFYTAGKIIEDAEGQAYFFITARRSRR